jgi:hypothetical protein
MVRFTIIFQKVRSKMFKKNKSAVSSFTDLEPIVSMHEKVDQKVDEKVDEKIVPKIIIDGKEYLIDDLSEAAKNQLGSLRATNAEIARLEALLAMLKTASMAYARAAKEELDKQ